MQLKAWWMRWGQLVQKLIALAASLASCVGLFVMFLPSPSHLPYWAIALLGSAAFFLAVLVILEISAYRGYRVYAASDAPAIRKYMHEWIRDGGRVAIWTRDLSWAQNEDTRRLLTEKAGRGELILCLPEQNALTRELEAAGAEVCAYGARYLESPASRFTITFFGRDGSRVAVGRISGDTHAIDEFSAGGHPAFHVAEDLIALARAQCADGQNG